LLGDELPAGVVAQADIVSNTGSVVTSSA
jgi:hypothetical protein